MTAKTKSRGNGQGTVFKRGTTWTACATACNPRRTKTKGGFTTKRDALAALPELRQQLLHGSAAPDNITFAKVYDKWETRHMERVASSTMDCYRAAYKWFEPLHPRIFTTISADDLQDCVDGCPRGAQTKANMKALATLLYKYAGSIRLADHNLGQYIYRGGDKGGTHEAFSASDLESIARAAAEGVPYADYILALIYLGYRPTEFLGLDKSQYDASRRCFIAGMKTEAGRNRIVTVSPKIQSIIDRRMDAPGRLVFPWQEDGSPMNDDSFRKRVFNPLMEYLKIENKVPYSCRHTFANLLKNVTGSDTDKAKLMGHADASMTKYYQSADYDSIRAITDRI